MGRVKGAVQLVHWHAGEAQERADRLRAAGYEVALWQPDGMSVIQQLKAQPPDAVVIDLTRLPSHGREVAVALRQMKATRQIPLVFVEGDVEKVARIRELLPDAVYTTWRGIGAALKRAMQATTGAPVVPPAPGEAYSKTPLPKKLGIKAGSVVALVDAPEGFRETLGDLPEGAKLRDGAKGDCDVMVVFARSVGALRRRMAQLGPRTELPALWFAWPKKASGVATDLSEAVVREMGLSAGLVDYKICAIDSTWSGLLFARRTGAATVRQKRRRGSRTSNV